MSVSPRWAKATLTGEAVALRPLVAADADAVWEMVHDPEGNELTATTAQFTRAQIDDWCATRAGTDARLDLAIIERATGLFAGEAVLNEHDPDHESCNFRIALRGPAWYGRGLGGEATRLIVQHGLHVVGLRCITLDVLARNPRAIRAYQSAGFVRTHDFTEDGEEWVHMEISRGSATPAAG